ncbi:hypothetical protein BLOT_006702 [Blomia tropicalis]|nr:hypothetical protein BLOT_006702 [Blomia tropicalis]
MAIQYVCSSANTEIKYKYIDDFIQSNSIRNNCHIFMFIALIIFNFLLQSNHFTSTHIIK